MSTERGVWDPTKVYVGDKMLGPDGVTLIDRPEGADIVIWQGARWIANYYHTGVNPSTDMPGDQGRWKLEPGSTPVYETVKPEAPTGLTAGYTNDDVVTLFWNPAYVPGIGDVTSYNIYANGVKIGSSTTTGFQVSGLDPSTNYVFSVDAENLEGASPKGTLSAATEGEQSGNGKYYSAFVDMTLPTTNIVELSRDSDQRDFTLAFMESNNADLDANGNLLAGKVPSIAWGGITNTTLPTGVIIDQVHQLQALGGTISISFGGYNGRDPAVICAQYSEQLQAGGISKSAADAKAADHLQSLYQQVMDTYGVTHLDFDIENSVFKNDESKKYPTVDDAEANHLRNVALKGLKADNADLHITFTVATLPNGVSTTPSVWVPQPPINGVAQPDVLSGSGDVEAMLQLAKADGVPIDVVNIMAMDYFDGQAANPDMGDNAISAAKSMHALLMTMGIDAKVGVTPMLGQNDAYNSSTHGNEVFTLADAQDVMDYFASTPWIAGFGAWQITRDRAASVDTTGQPPVADGTGLIQDDFEFSSILSQVSLWRAIGGRGDDVIEGNALGNTLSGNDGVDVLSGLGGNDTLNGGAGIDTLNGGIGNDNMIGGTGDDSYYVDAAADKTTETTAGASGGNDTVFSTISRTLGINLEILRLQGTDNLNGTGNAQDNKLYGNTGNNQLKGLDGVDTLDGGAGNDTLDGGIGADTLIGGAGNDTYVNPTGDVIVEAMGTAAGQHDLVQSNVSFSLATLPNVEDITLTGAGKINAVGNNFANILTGNVNANTLNGGGGNDVLNGGGGNDTMNGGTGADRFVFQSAASGNDTINGFVAAEDLFDLSGGTFSNRFEAGGNTTLSYAGGTIVVTGVTGLSLGGWNALIASGARSADTGGIHRTLDLPVASMSRGVAQAPADDVAHVSTPAHVDLSSFHGAADFLFA